MSHRSAIATALICCGLLACSGGAPEPTTPAQPTGDVEGSDAPGGEKTAKDAEGPATDVSPVKAPGAVVFHMRWEDPEATVRKTAGVAGMPPQLANQVLEEGVREIVREGLRKKVDTGRMAELIATDAPIDVLVVADTSRGGQIPEPMLAVSVGLTSLHGALDTSKGRARKIGDGVWLVGTKDKWGEPCAVAAAAGEAPARLVCSESETQLGRVAPFAARNVAGKTEDQPDLRAKVELRPVLDKYGRQWANQARGLPVIAEELKMGIPTFDEALMDAADALAHEAGALLQDADSIVIDFGFDDRNALSLGLDMQFRGKRSWMVQSMLDGAKLQGPPPEMFWKLPAHATTVSYGHTGDPAMTRPVLETSQALLEGFLEKEKVGTAADRKAIAKLLRVPWGKHQDFVSASGHFDPPKKARTAIEEVASGTVGWFVMGVSESPKGMRRYLGDVVRAYNRPTLQRMMKKELGPDSKHLPKMKVVPAPTKLGAGSYAIEIVIPDVESPPLTNPTGKSKSVDLEGHLLLMRDGSRSWLGFGMERDPLAEIMTGLKGKGGSDTLASEPTLQHLKNESHSGATVTSLDGIVAALKPGMTMWLTTGPPGMQRSSPAKKMERILKGMPHKGKTPMTATVDVEDAAQPRLSIALEVQRGTLEDIGYLLKKLGSAGGP